MNSSQKNTSEFQNFTQIQAPVRPGFQEALAERVRTATLYEAEKHPVHNSLFKKIALPLIGLAGVATLSVAILPHNTTTPWTANTVQAAVISSLEEFTDAVNSNRIVHFIETSSENENAFELFRSGTQFLGMHYTEQHNVADAYLQAQPDIHTLLNCQYDALRKQCDTYAIKQYFEKAPNSTATPTIALSTSDVGDSLIVVTWKTAAPVTEDISIDAIARYSPDAFTKDEIHQDYGARQHVAYIHPVNSQGDPVEKQPDIYSAEFNTPTEQGYVQTLSIISTADFAAFDELTIQLSSGSITSPVVRYTTSNHAMSTLEDSARTQLSDRVYEDQLLFEASLNQDQRNAPEAAQRVLSYFAEHLIPKTINETAQEVSALYTVDEEVSENEKLIAAVGTYTIVIDKETQNIVRLTRTYPDATTYTTSFDYTTDWSHNIFTKEYIDQLFQ